MKQSLVDSPRQSLQAESPTLMTGQDHQQALRSQQSEHAAFTVLPALSGLETVHAHYHKQTFSKHVHESYTIGLIQSGAQQFYRTGAQHVAPENTIILVNADEVHTGQTATSNGWIYRAIYPTPEQFEQAAQDSLVRCKGIPYFPHAVLKDDHMAKRMKHFFMRLDAGASLLETESLLYDLLNYLIQQHSQTRPEVKHPAAYQRGIQQAKAYLHANPQDNISLEELAKIAHLSAYHFLRQFKKIVGLPPHAYQVQLRLQKAKSLLKLGTQPSQAALLAGFHDQSHLNRYFKQALGTTPSKYQKHSNFVQ